MPVLVWQFYYALVISNSFGIENQLKKVNVGASGLYRSQIYPPGRGKDAFHHEYQAVKLVIPIGQFRVEGKLGNVRKI
jgi:hypothetical protein